MINLDPHNLRNLGRADFEATAGTLRERLAAKVEAARAPRNLALAFEFLGRRLPAGRCLIHGAGEHSRLLIPALDELDRVSVAAVIDRQHAAIGDCCGHPVVSLQAGLELEHDFILVANFLHETGMIRELVEAGVPRERIFALYSNPDYLAHAYDRVLAELCLGLPAQSEFVILNDHPGVFDTRALTRFLPPERTVLLQDFPRAPNLFYRTVDTQYSLQLMVDLLRRLRPRIIYVRTFIPCEFLACLARTACPEAKVIHEILDLALLTPDAQLVETGCLSAYDLETARLAELDSFMHSALVLTKRGGPVFGHLLEATGASFRFVFPWLTAFQGADRPAGPPAQPIRIVYAGQLYPAAMQTVLKGEWNYYPLFRTLAEGGHCTIDIFNSLHKSVHDDARFREFMDEPAPGGRIAYHRAVAFAQVAGELARFDYGFTYTEYPNDQNIDRAESISARATGYANSGVPMIIDDGLVLMAELIQRFDAGIVLPRYAAGRLGPALLAAHPRHPELRAGMRRLHAHMTEVNEQVIRDLQDLVGAQAHG